MDVNRGLDMSLQRIGLASAIALPWDSGPVSAILDSGAGMDWITGMRQSFASWPLLVSPPPPVATPRLAVSVGSAKKRRIYVEPRPSYQDNERAVQLAKWLQLVVLVPGASSVGLQVQEVGADEAFEVLSDVLAAKSTSTLRIRSASLLLFLKWAGDAAAPFPIDEKVLYSYPSTSHEGKLHAACLVFLPSASSTLPPLRPRCDAVALLICSISRRSHCLRNRLFLCLWQPA